MSRYGRGARKQVGAGTSASTRVRGAEAAASAGRRPGLGLGGGAQLGPQPGLGRPPRGRPGLHGWAGPPPWDSGKRWDSGPGPGLGLGLRLGLPRRAEYAGAGRRGPPSSTSRLFSPCGAAWCDFPAEWLFFTGVFWVVGFYFILPPLSPATFPAPRCMH